MKRVVVPARQAAWESISGPLITINVPLFKKLRDIIFFWWDNHFIYLYNSIHRMSVYVGGGGVLQISTCTLAQYICVDSKGKPVPALSL
jgi:hypothetical protein